MTNELKVEPFSDAMRIFLDYIARQTKKNPKYKPHSLIRAFECAVGAAEGLKEGACTMGVSGDGIAENILNPYIVVLQKRDFGIEVKEIRNVKVNKELPLDVMVMTFRLQIHLDKIGGDTVSPKQMIEVLNAVIPGDKFYSLGDRWEEARDKFRDQMEAGKIHIPPDPELIDALKNIRYDAPWEEYPNTLRALIGISIAPSINRKGGIVVITSPKDSKIEKVKVTDQAIEFMLGQSAGFLNLGEEQEKNKNEHKDG